MSQTVTWYDIMALPSICYVKTYRQSRNSSLPAFSPELFFVNFFSAPKEEKIKLNRQTKHLRKNMEAKKLLIMFWAVALTSFSEGGQLAKSNLLVPTQPPSFESKVSLKSNRFLKKSVKHNTILMF